VQADEDHLSPSVASGFRRRVPFRQFFSLELASLHLPTYGNSSMDKLESIFSMQEDLNARIGVGLKNMSEEEQIRWVLNYTRAMQQELAELVDSVPWKWWAKYQEFDKQNARVEVVDLFHFLVSLAQTLGMSAEDVFEAYQKKNKVNHARQEAGYTAKDHEDSKHI
jgi:dimeric dUTPase (all-alpha-NTP-PPase superfamily)